MTQCGKYVILICNKHTQRIGSESMINTLRVTYHYNSGFSIHLGDVLLVFDYWEGGEDSDLNPAAKLSAESLATYRRIYAFVSTSRPDHLDNKIYEWQKLGNVRYITSDDVELQPNTQFIHPGQTIDLEEGYKVTAFPSTDKGISLLIQLENFSIFYAGNYNLWHWREQDSLEQIEKAQDDFKRILTNLQDKEVTVAFFPLDPRQGLYFEAGAVQYIMKIRPKFFIPMHFTFDPEVVGTFARDYTNDHSKIIAMDEPGSIVNIEKLDNGYRAIMVATSNDKFYSEIVRTDSSN